MGSPLLEIGTADGPEETLFQLITGIVPLPEGRLAVADNGYLTVRVYDSDGRFLHSMGKRGVGPGEFYAISGIWLTSNEELAIWDEELLRFTRFTQAGQHVESRRVLADNAVGNLQVFFGPLPDDEVLLAMLTGGPRRNRQAETNNPYVLQRYHISGEFRGVVGHVEGMHRYNGTPMPFSPVPWVTTRNDRVYVAAGYEPEIEVRDRYGTLLRTMAVPAQRAATRDDLSELERALGQRDDLEVGPYYARVLREGLLPFDERMPAIAGLLVSDDGLIWVKTFHPLRASRWIRARVRPPAPGGEWLIIDPGLGTVIARVELPSSLVPIRVGERRIIGKDIDQLGVERVVVHELRR